MVVKINVSFPEDLLDKLDEAAREAHLSRSRLLSQAVIHFLDEKQKQKKLEYQHMAVREIDRIREEYGPWDGTKEVLKWREKH